MIWHFKVTRFLSERLLEMKTITGKEQWIVTVAGVWCFVNATIIALLGIATVLGNRFVFQANGIGPNRIAISSIFGPLAPYTGWLLIGISILAAAEAVGILTRHPWSRLALLAIAIVAFVVTSIAVAWSLQKGEWGTAFWGGMKVALYAAVIALLRSRRARHLFSRHAYKQPTS